MSWRYLTLVFCSIDCFANSAIAAEFAISYDSRYVTEGRNNLKSGGIIWFTANKAANQKVSATFAYGVGTSTATDYDELNLILTYDDNIGSLNWYSNISVLMFFEDDDYDNEIGLGASYVVYDSIEVFTDLYYSTKASGYFFETGIRHQLALTENWQLSGYVLSGFDFGYISPIHDGHNHNAFGMSLDFEYSEHALLSVRIDKTFDGNDISKQQADSNGQTWMGITFSSVF